MDSITCVIEGVTCRVPPVSVLEAALSQGFSVPHLCWVRDRRRPRASCGLCFVEVSGFDRPVRACEVQVSEGMEVSLSSSRAEELAKGAFRLLMADHRLDCANCARGSSGCELRDLARRFGVPLRSDLRLDAAGESGEGRLRLEGFSFDHTKCVLCARCVEACEDAGVRLLGVFGRGARSSIGAIDLEGVATGICPSCGSCIEACPAGALTRASI